MSDVQPITMAITPEPTPEELAAIVAAVTAALNVCRVADLVSAPPLPQPSRWAAQGRVEAMRGRCDDVGDRRT